MSTTKKKPQNRQRSGAKAEATIDTTAVEKVDKAEETTEEAPFSNGPSLLRRAGRRVADANLRGLGQGLKKVGSAIPKPHSPITIQVVREEKAEETAPAEA